MWDLSSPISDWTYIPCIGDSLFLTPKRFCIGVKVTQSCPTLCDPKDYTVHEILQARILEWVAILFSRGSSQPREWNWVSSITGRFFTCLSHWQILYLCFPLIYMEKRFATDASLSPTFSAWAMGFPDERVYSYRPQWVWFWKKWLKGTFFKNQLWPKKSTERKE